MQKCLKLSAWLTISMSTFSAVCAGNGIHFLESKNWQEVLAKAKVEKKFVFVYCTATWSKPCREMEKSTYQSEQVGDLTQKNFICIKVQMDTTTQDDEHIKTWYPDANILMRKDDINTFPSFLFFGPDGNILHRSFGYMDSTNFIVLLKDALTPNKQYYTLLTRYESGEKDYSSMAYLVGLERELGNRNLADTISADYLQNYLYTLSDSKLLTKDNIIFMMSAVKSSKERGFRFFYQHVGEIDQLMNRNNYAETLVERIIYNEEVYPNLWKDVNSPATERPNWEGMMHTISTKYNEAYAKIILLDTKINWYSYKKDWPELIKYQFEKLETNAFDTTYMGMVRINNMLYGNVFMHCDDTAILNKALQWEGIIIKKYPKEGTYLDTYANLLYKLGRTSEALDLEEKALQLEPGNEETKANYMKIKKGKPTWVAEK
jgi:thioredoxin-related protein